MPTPPKDSLVIIGAGNVASHLAPALHRAGYEVRAVFSRNINHAQPLADKVGAEAACSLETLPEADIFFYCVSDDALPTVAEALCKRFPDALHVHTSGSSPLSVFPAARCGVAYPLQTFSRGADVDFRHVRMFIEGKNDDCCKKIASVCKKISNFVTEMRTDQRLWLHLASVFACNFANHCFALAADILHEKANLPFEVLLPLVDATVEKAHYLPPAAGQTGPAARNDQRIMQLHERLLADNSLRLSIYEAMSQSIRRTAEAGKHDSTSTK